MQRGFYHNCSDSSCLLRAPAELRAIAVLEFLLDQSSSDGLLLSQLAIDLRMISSGASLRSTAVWRAFSAQFSKLFCPRPYNSEGKPPKRARPVYDASPAPLQPGEPGGLS